MKFPLLKKKHQLWEIPIFQSCHFNHKSGAPTELTAVRLAQLEERWSAEQEVASSNPGWTNTQGLKNN